jgi:hypothetical protein
MTGRKRVREWHAATAPDAETSGLTLSGPTVRRERTTGDRRANRVRRLLRSESVPVIATFRRPAVYAIVVIDRARRAVRMKACTTC